MGKVLIVQTAAAQEVVLQQFFQVFLNNYNELFTLHLLFLPNKKYQVINKKKRNLFFSGKHFFATLKFSRSEFC
jgi:hypothetical protein